jgi:putative ABC transport system permease protein
VKGSGVGLALLGMLLRLLPREAREQDGRDIEALCRSRHDDLHPASRGRLVMFWVSELASVAGAVTLAWVDALREQIGSGLPDLRSTLRILGRRPSFGLTAVLVLGVGIGAAGGVGSLGWSALVAPLPYPDADRLVRLFHSNDLTFGVSLNELLHYGEASRSLAAVAGWSVSGATVGVGEQATRIVIARVTPDLLAVLGRRPAAGYDFSRDGAEREVLLSHRFWKSFFGGDPAVVGDILRIEDEPYRVAGVLPADVAFPDRTVDVWLPIALPVAGLQRRGGTFLDVIARLRPGVRLATASAEVNVLAHSMRRRDPAAYHAEPDFGGYLADFRDVQVRHERPLLVALAAAAVLLLVATCSNVVLLQHARARRRAGEMAVRRALGAGAGTLLRMHLAETALLLAGGTALGVVLAAVFETAVGALVPDGRALAGPPSLLDIGAAVAGSAAVAAVLLLVSAPRYGRTREPSFALGGARTSAPLPSLRYGLPAVQVALALILITGSFVLLQTVRSLTSIDLGYEVDSRLSARITLSPSRYPDAPAHRAFFRRLEAEWEAQPRVLRVGLVSSLPMSAYGGGGDVYIRSVDPDSALDVVTQRLVSPGYFATLGIPLLAGRLFGPEDREDVPRVAIVDDEFARRWFGNPRSALGQQIRFFMGGEDWNDIVGVVGRVRSGGPASAPSAHVYVPFEQRPSRTAHVVSGTTGILLCWFNRFVVPSQPWIRPFPSTTLRPWRTDGVPFFEPSARRWPFSPRSVRWPSCSRRWGRSASWR